MKVLSLFSGVGGFDMGLENAGMETVFQCEWDKHANTILHKHWPDVPKWDDVSTLTGKHILAHAPVVDVVAWGSPCQDLSVAGKRAGLEGGRSGLFHEGIRIIKELQEETNGQYPRISIWENVVGALNSNRGADFGIILDEMAEAGALAIEWSVLDAQYFGIPQRRRRVFVIAIFDPVLANRCPSPLLPVAESLPGHLAKSKPKRKSITSETSTSVGASSADTKSLDEQSYAESFFAQFKEGDVAALKASGGVLGGGSETLIVGALTVSDLTKQVTNEIVSKNLLQVVEPFVKSSRAQTSEDSETWIPGEVNPTLNSFDVGDTRATTAIVEPVMLNYQGSKGNSVTSEDGLSFSLNAMHGHDVHVVTEQMENRPVKEIVGSLQARVTATNHESIRDAHAIVEEMTLIDGQRVGDVRIYTEPVQTLGARMGTGGNNVPMLAFDTQFGSNANVTEDVAPTLKASQQSPSVAYAIQGNVVGRQDHNGPAGKGHTEEGDQMFTLTSTDIHAVAYDEYNDTTNNVHHALRAGTKQSTGVLEPTMAVRRLTPLECERLMGWPDDHTRYKADGTEQADTHRYKQCGNGVASPVAQWIAKHILNI
jgi:DNA (cytosine-5)-methyltransferase 1